MTLSGVITREDGDPWGKTGMTSAKWRNVPSQTVFIADLTATQPGVLFAGLIEDREPEGGDPYPHVVKWGGRLYLEDGHHRVMRAALRGDFTVTVRVIEVPL